VQPVTIAKAVGTSRERIVFFIRPTSFAFVAHFANSKNYKNPILIRLFEIRADFECHNYAFDQAIDEIFSGYRQPRGEEGFQVHAEGFVLQAGEEVVEEAVHDQAAGFVFRDASGGHVE